MGLFLGKLPPAPCFIKYLNENGKESVQEQDVVVTEKTYNKVKEKHLEDLKEKDQ